MYKIRPIIYFFSILIFINNFSHAEPPPASAQPIIIPAPPVIKSKAYTLIDVQSGKVIAEKNGEQKLAPASLTKMMTLYVISDALSKGQITLNDMVRISKNAWKTGGSRMFVKEGQQVSIENLLKGIIVDSGNDACVAMAEYLSGGSESFSQIMNQHAKALGMMDSNFTDSTGLPNKNLYSTAKDLSILGRALVVDFPQYYHWYKQKWFEFNGIRQPNRNKLLWRDENVDGIKTGYTEDAGYCLVSSAKQNNMRLIAVVLGAPDETSRADDSERLLNYGFRFYETHKLYEAKKALTELPIYKGTQNNIPVGLKESEYITIPKGQYNNLNVKIETPKNIEAPVQEGAVIGKIVVTLNNKPIAEKPLISLKTVEPGGILKRSKDALKLMIKNL